MAKANRLRIDGEDALTKYGILVPEGGYDGIVQWPDMNEPDYIDWPEEDGVEPDLLSVTLKPKESIRVDFAGVNDQGTDDFIAMLQSESYHVFDFHEIGVTIPLRYKSVMEIKRVDCLAKMSVEFAFDYGFLDEVEPYEGETGYLTFKGQRLSLNGKLLVFTHFDEDMESHVVIRKKKTGLLLDGKDIGDYGCLALEGTDEEITRAAPLKDNLIIKAFGLHGQLYPDSTAVKGIKTAAIPMLLRAVNPSLFWKDYLALLTDLTANGGRVLTWKGKTYKCFYESQTIEEFAKLGSNEIWCQFTVTLCFYGGE